MFKSNTSVKKLFEMVGSDADIRVSITDDNLIFWYNSLMTSLYLDVIKSVKKKEKSIETNGSLTFSDGTECIVRIVFDGLPELEKVSALFAASTERPVWYEKDEVTAVTVNIGNLSECSVYSYELPSKVTSVKDESVVPLPDNFVELAKYKLLAEMYNAANDDILSAKYFGFYNTRLEDFRLWIMQNSPSLK